MEAIIAIGISGSGKTSLYNAKYSDYELISPDNVRRDVFGDVNDQSNNKAVFDIINKRIGELLEQGKSFYYDATNLHPRYRKEMIERFRPYGATIKYIVFPADIKTSYRRIKNDIHKGINRPNVKYRVLYRQYQAYIASVKSGFAGEDVDEIKFI